ncbi:hypothetical protein Tco_0876431 [Tanacetum coccineum]|uniref:Uncharacterized protein n=1 Tax=Tanacetum coccineum TaxID=301880 RepID=A0ABQ5BS97_9ASTR
MRISLNQCESDQALIYTAENQGFKKYYLLIHKITFDHTAFQASGHQGNDVRSPTFRPRTTSTMVSAENNTSGPAPTRIQVHNHEQTSSKLVLKVVPLAVKTATSRQELELLFHHHIAMAEDNSTKPDVIHYLLRILVSISENYLRLDVTYTSVYSDSKPAELSGVPIMKSYRRGDISTVHRTRIRRTFRYSHSPKPSPQITTSHNIDRYYRGEDKDEEDDEDEEEEEEHLAPADSTVVHAWARLPRTPRLPYPSPPEARGERLARCMAPPAHSPPLPPSSGEDIPDLTASRKRFIVSSICSRYEIGESSTARPARGQGIDYGLSARPVPEIANLYRGEETVWMVEEEAYASREAWAHSIGLSQATHQELQTHRDHVYAYKTHLQAHQTQLQLQGPRWIETLRVIRDMRREMSDMQAELLALREQRRRARQSGPEARIPDHQEASW